MRIRQIALVAADLEATLATLQEVLGIELAFRDPGVATFGLSNGVMPVGEHFLEVVSPATEGTSAGRYLERRDGDGGYMVIFQTRDLAAMRNNLEAEQVRIVWEIALDDIATVHLHPRDNGGAIVSMDEARPWESWRWAGPDWPGHVRRERVTGLAGVEIQTENPEALAQRWSEIFELPRIGKDVLTLPEDDGTIRFCKATDGRGEGIRSVLVKAADPEAVLEAARKLSLPVEDDAVVIAGTRFVLV